MEVKKDDTLNLVNEQIINELKKIDAEESKKLNLSVTEKPKLTPNSNR